VGRPLGPFHCFFAHAALVYMSFIIYVIQKVSLITHALVPAGGDGVENRGSSTMSTFYSRGARWVVASEASTEVKTQYRESPCKFHRCNTFLVELSAAWEKFIRSFIFFICSGKSRQRGPALLSGPILCDSLGNRLPLSFLAFCM